MLCNIINSRVGSNRGSLRIWLEGGKLSRSGYQPSDKYDIQVFDTKIILVRSNTGQYSISSRKRGKHSYPLIEITSIRCAALKELFQEQQLIRVVINSKSITISQHHLDERITEREQRLLNKISNNEPLESTSLFYGYGVLDRAVHDGLASAGVKSKIAVIVEQESKYLDPSLNINHTILSNNSFIIESQIEHVQLSDKKRTDLLIAGLPCTGASKSGKTKNKLELAEQHKSAGSMFFYFLRFIEALNPSCISFENVCEYANTAGMSVIRAVLENWGYKIYETIIKGEEFGVLEARNRFCMIAISKNLAEIDIEYLLDEVKLPNTKIMNDIMEQIELDSAVWKEYSYLAHKEIKDISTGKGFRRQLLNGESNKCGTIGRSYNKARSTEPFILHPENPKLSRLLTVKEHARVKGFPEDLMSNEMYTTTAHEALGQSVIYPAFKALWTVMGYYFKSLLLTKNIYA